MTRSPKEVIEAIIANLEMARAATYPRAHLDDSNSRFLSGQEHALRQAMELIRTEAADILKGNE